MKGRRLHVRMKLKEKKRRMKKIDASMIKKAFEDQFMVLIVLWLITLSFSLSLILLHT